MPRRSRLAIPHLPHHIVQRGHNRAPVFSTDADRSSYLETLAEFRDLLGIKVYAWCLMSNHVHIVVDPGATVASLGLLMKRLAGRHTRRMNLLEKRSGTAWDGRYKCSPIDSARYLLACTRYVELNPVRAGMVQDPADYRWSSYRSRMGLDPRGSLDLDPCFLMLGPTLDEQRTIYRQRIAVGMTQSELASIRTALQRNQLTGSDDFALEVERQFGMHVTGRGRGRAGFPRTRAARPAPSPENRSVPSQGRSVRPIR